MKICILFPGIGYHCDKPLLYYSAKLADHKGYDKIIKLSFSGLDKNLSAAQQACSQAEEQLADVDLSVYNDIVFIGKSIGTVVCQHYRHEHDIYAKSILLTPLIDTFAYPSENSTVFHGTSDPWAETEKIKEICQNNSLPMYLYENANHSLETGDPAKDILTVSDVINKIGALI